MTLAFENRHWDNYAATLSGASIEEDAALETLENVYSVVITLLSEASLNVQGKWQEELNVARLLPALFEAMGHDTHDHIEAYNISLLDSEIDRKYDIYVGISEFMDEVFAAELSAADYSNIPSRTRFFAKMDALKTTTPHEVA